MPYIPPEVVEQARQIDLLTYLQSCEPQELVRISGNNYTTRTHDSLKISNGKWMWWSQRIGGYNALDYLVKVKGCSFVEAVETLMGKAAVMPSVTVKLKQKTEPKILLLPDKSASTDILKKGNRKKYCGRCAVRAYKKQQAAYARRKRAESKNRG